MIQVIRRPELVFATPVGGIDGRQFEVDAAVAVIAAMDELYPLNWIVFDAV
jgi:hypothetical protein